MASGMGNMKMSLIYEIRKCSVAEKKPDGAVEIGSSSFFAVPLPSLSLIFTNLRAKFTSNKPMLPCRLVQSVVPSGQA
jgi:hypothetical protein